MKEQAEKLKARTHAFFVRVIELCDALDGRPAARSIARQLVDAAGGTDRNYRAVCRARSKKEFIAKLGVAIEEADECLGWLNALRAANLGDAALVASLAREADELTRIFVKSRQTAQTNLAREELAGQGRRHPKR
jgi:four helix bundle protein